MRVRVVGSADAKGIPRPFCACRVCDAARHSGGKDLRTRTHVQIFIDREDREPLYAIDLSPDLARQTERDGFQLRSLEHLLVTHEDPDHLFAPYLRWRGTSWGAMDELPILTVYGSPGVVKLVSDTVGDLEAARLRVRVIHAGDRFRMGELEVQAVAANHGAEGALHYAVSHNGRSVLFAWDTGPWHEQTWEQVAGLRPDALFIECTYFARGIEPKPTHLTFDQMLEMTARLQTLGVINGATPIITVHQGDNGGLTHSEMEELAAPHGIMPSYDGFELEI